MYLDEIADALENGGGGGGGGGFTPTDAQLDAMNSGITSEDVEQISTNKNNISSFHKADNTNVYFSETEPTGTIPLGSYWLSTDGISEYIQSPQLLDISQIIVGKSWYYETNSNKAVVFIEVTPNTAYAIQVNELNVDTVFICEKTTVEATTAITDTGRTINNTTAITFTTTATTGCIAVQYNKTSITAEDCESCEVMVNSGAEIMPYAPYGNVWS